VSAYLLGHVPEGMSQRYLLKWAMSSGTAIREAQAAQDGRLTARSAQHRLDRYSDPHPGTVRSLGPGLLAHQAGTRAENPALDRVALRKISIRTHSWLS
jgi:hypothetical protein